MVTKFRSDVYGETWMENDLVYKKYRVDFENYNFTRELECLKLLNKYDVAAPLVSYDLKEKIIVMKYCGKSIEELNKIDLPDKEINKQLNNINKALDLCRIHHKNLHPYHICYDERDKKLRMIDFGWSMIYTTDEEYEQKAKKKVSRLVNKLRTYLIDRKNYCRDGLFFSDRIQTITICGIILVIIILFLLLFTLVTRK